MMSSPTPRARPRGLLMTSSRRTHGGSKAIAGRSVPAGLEAVAHHLSICSECCDEYKSLLQTLQAMDG